MRKLMLIALSLALSSLIFQTVRSKAGDLRLPEPPLPSCLVEVEKTGANYDGSQSGYGHGGLGLAVGRLEFNPVFISRLEAVLRSKPRGPKARMVTMALDCASETAKSLREALNTIRRANAE